MPAPQHNQGGSGTHPYRRPPPFASRRLFDSLFAIRHSPFAIRRLSPLATRCSLLAVFHHSPFAIRRLSPLATRCSLLAIPVVQPARAQRRCAAPQAAGSIVLLP
jgi:hypothetical protein